MNIINVYKIFLPATASFFLGIMLAPILTHYLYKYKAWKKKPKEKALGGGDTPIFQKLHGAGEVSVPRMGGVIIWVSAILTTLLFAASPFVVSHSFLAKMSFLSRNQTWLPLFTLFIASLVGLFDDYLTIKGTGGYIAGGIPLRFRILIVLLIGAVGAWWFYTKLGVSTLFIPYLGDVYFGILMYPLFMLTMLALFSGGVIDGIDGLAGGIMAAIFASYAGIAFFQNQIDLAAFCAVIVGSILAFLWFNIPPARFYMSETGILGLTTTLTVVAFLTNSVVVLPVIALPLFVASGSVIIQLLSKKIRGKKVFLVAPIHHHFEALGWPPYKVTMRFWVVSVMSAIFGMVLALLGK